MNFLNKLLTKSWKIYEDSFPKDERRDLNQQKNLLKKEDYKFISIIENKKVLGLLGVWDLENFLFIEHFAIDKNLRNKGLGSEIIKKYLDSTDKLVVLEAERPDSSEIAERRIGFWERAGFNLNNYDYIQPPYSSDKSPVPLYIMSYPRKINKSEFNNIRKKIHNKVYCLEKPLTKIILKD